MRTDQEILERYRRVKDGDFLGFKGEVLLLALTVEGAKSSGLFKSDATFEDWPTTTEESLTDEVRRYMEFAWEKVRNHRGISASRSVDKIGEMAWLLGREDVVQAMDTAQYEQYGAPKLAAACTLLALPIPEGEDIQNMIQGRPCYSGCDEGCGR